MDVHLTQSNNIVHVYARDVVTLWNSQSRLLSLSKSREAAYRYWIVPKNVISIGAYGYIFLLLWACLSPCLLQRYETSSSVSSAYKAYRERKRSVCRHPEMTLISKNKGCPFYIFGCHPLARSLIHIVMLPGGGISLSQGKRSQHYLSSDRYSNPRLRL
jgi:hypothetical protein